MRLLGSGVERPAIGSTATDRVAAARRPVKRRSPALVRGTSGRHRGRTLDAVTDRDSTTAPSLWRQTDFLMLWTGQTVSELGSVATRTAVPACVARPRRGSDPLALLVVAGTPGTLLVGLLAGAWVDRLRRRSTDRDEAGRSRPCCRSRSRTRPTSGGTSSSMSSRLARGPSACC